MGLEIARRERDLIALLSGGGDSRITLTGKGGLNKYLSAPYPRDVLAYSSSTISDISADAFDHLAGLYWEEASYTEQLEDIRQRIKAAYSIHEGAEIVFAPSGTDLEYVALAAVLGKAEGGVHNVLLGADEIGSGCIHSALGRYFAKETALEITVEPATEVAGVGPVSMVDVPVRCGAGLARESAVIVGDMVREIEAARASGKHSLVHGVHGSKTGLVLPGLHDIDALQARFGRDVTIVIDACQARITSEAISDYIARGAIVLMTGSKFIGAPPFNGWALIPQDLADCAGPLPAGFATIFRRAEWPENWAGREALLASTNLSLALRLEAALFEIERFQQLAPDQIEAIIAAFEEALIRDLIETMGVRRVLPGGTEQDLPIEMRTLATLDVSMLPGFASFDDAQTQHRLMALDGVRLGQPVKCVSRGDAGWGGTLRVGLSMPQMVVWSELPIENVKALISKDMRAIAKAIAAHCST